jgi:hypothetical protein
MNTEKYDDADLLLLPFVAVKVRANFFRCHTDKNTADYGIFSV